MWFQQQQQQQQQPPQKEQQEQPMSGGGCCELELGGAAGDECQTSHDADVMAPARHTAAAFPRRGRRPAVYDPKV